MIVIRSLDQDHPQNVMGCALARNTPLVKKLLQIRAIRIGSDHPQNPINYFLHVTDPW